MNYLVLFILFFLVSCSSDKDLVDVEYYMKQGKEISLVKKFDFEEVKKINSLVLSKPLVVTDWPNKKLNASNHLPRFLIDDFKRKTSFDISVKSFLVIKKNIYAVDKYSNLIVLDENLKELKRKFIYKNKEFENYPLEFHMTSDGKLIYISDNLGNVHGVDIENLKIKWSLKLGVPIKSDLYFYNNDLFFVNTNSKLYSVKSSNGEINWSHETASKVSKENYQISIFNNLLITNNDYGEIFCYDLLKKNILWKLSLTDKDYMFKLKNFTPSSPVYVSGILYFSSNFGETIAIEAASGKAIWRKYISSTNTPIINNNYVFLINEKGFFYILDKLDGNVIFSKNLSKLDSEKKEREIIFYDMILGKSYIYFINSTKNLIKLDINNMSSIKIDNYSLNNPKSFFVLNNYLYILEEKKISKFYN